MIGRTNADGGGGVSSDETTVVASQVLTGKTYLGSDTDDEAGTGTMPNIQAVDPAKSLSYGSGLVYARMSNGAHITNASGGYPEVSITTQTKSVSPTASSQTVSPDANKVLSGVTVNGVSNLTAGNIKNGVTVGGTAGTYKGLGNASASQVLSGATFSTASLSNASGTMPNYSGYTSTGNYVSSTFRSATSGYVYASPGATGYYSTGSYLRIPASNLTAANIKKGVSIMGIIGSFEGYVSSPLYLYNSGVWSNLQTTGVYTDGIAKIISGTLCLGYPSFWTSSKYITLTARLNQIFDLSHYNFIKIAFDALNHSSDPGGVSPNNVIVGISNTAFSVTLFANTGSFLYPDGIIASISGTRGNTVILDISNISGAYYIYFGTLIKNSTKAGNCGITQIFLTNN